MRLKRWLYRSLGIASPTGSYPMSPFRIGRERGRESAAEVVRGMNQSLAALGTPNLSGDCGGDPFDDRPCVPGCGLCEHSPYFYLSTRPNEAQKGDEGLC